MGNGLTLKSPLKKHAHGTIPKSHRSRKHANTQQIPLPKSREAWHPANTPNIKLIYPDHLASGPLDWDKLPPCPASRLGRLKFGFYGC